MKKDFFKALFKTAVTAAMVAAIFIGTGKDAKAVTFIPVPENAFDYMKYAAENPDVAAAFGEDAAALYNHYVTYGINEGRKAYYTDGTAMPTPGTPVNQPVMLALVNADRAAAGVSPLTWDDELAVYALQRAAEVSANYHSAAYAAAEAAGNNEAARSAAHSGIRRQTGENALLDWSVICATSADARWINSPSHHDNRRLPGITKYAAASYVDPLTGHDTWVELIEY